MYTQPKNIIDCCSNIKKRELTNKQAGKEDEDDEKK